MLRRVLLAGSLLVVFLALGASPAATSPAAPCSYGDARQQFESFPLTFQGTPPCQFRLFFTGRTFTFSEDDYFLGGINFRVPYDVRSPSGRAEAIARLEANVVRTWIAEVTADGVGEFVEQPLQRTAVKTWSSPELGQHVWQQWGFIAQLPVGEYLARTERSSPAGVMTWTVRLVITPAAS